MNSGENLPNLINQFIEKSLSAFEDAKILAENKRWNACINRRYYACFYIVKALLLQKEDVRTKTHSGIKTLFNRLIVKPGLVGKEETAFIH